MLGSRALFCGRIWNHSLFPKRSGNFRASFRTKRVGTHNGTFHCDETLACFMLRLSSRFSGAQIVRTRDHQVRIRSTHHLIERYYLWIQFGVLEKLNAALDVGGVYDPESERYDHHQKGFTEVFGHGFNTKLSSAGLIYKAVDAIDNGIHQYDTDQPPRYVNNTSLAHRIGRLNLDWIEPDQSSSKEDEAFHRAMELAGSEFLQWKLHIFELEEEMKIDPPIKYVLYQDDRSENWRIQAVSVSPDKFESRKALPISWRGLEKEKLSEESSIPGCVFVHMSGFIGANRSYEGALAMAKASLVA
ncbi:hypothetical protein Bca101_005768 [Brassica carinata]